MITDELDHQLSIINALKLQAQLQAVQRYESRLQEIEEIRRQIELVHQGKLSLVQIDTSKARVDQRIEREHAPRHIAEERINGTNDFQDAFIIDKLAHLKNAVCRLTLNGRGLGTGFMVAEGIIITNHHVIPDEATAQRMEVEFGYEFDSNKILKKADKFSLHPQLFFCTSSIAPVAGDATSGLDFTLVAVDPSANLSRYTVAPLDGTLGKIVMGELCITIQHPAGEPKKVVLKNISLLKLTETHLIYESDTLPGSSGSMVVGLGTGEIIALHHAGVPKRNAEGRPVTKSGAVAYPGTPDEQIAWEGNEGVRVSCIINAIEQMALPKAMEPFRQKVLRRTNDRRQIRQEAGKMVTESVNAAGNNKTEKKNVNMETTAINMGDGLQANELTSFIILVKNKPVSISQVNAFLTARYGRPIKIQLLTPATAIDGADELFEFVASPKVSLSDEAAELTRFTYIQAAEADVPLALNTYIKKREGGAGTESIYESGVKDKVWEDEFASWNEEAFQKEWAEAEFVKGREAHEFRRWNHDAARFDKLTDEDFSFLKENPVFIAQLDTGFTNHFKVVGGFDQDLDVDLIDNDSDATDELQGGVLKFPGHGTRTGSILIGKQPLFELTDSATQHDGNYGLISKAGSRIIPFRIAETVLLLNRQKELAKAVDRAIASGVQVMTMSMGTAPTITTARLAKKTYDAGVIWCCAAGNEVKFVVAPAVFPGTIAVAAHNPDNGPWPKSSVGDAVDITAPGQDVYVPIFAKGPNGTRLDDFAYGSGTSYATPHVAAAAALWLAKYKTELLDVKGWQRVEAFRTAITQTARQHDKLPGRGYGAGILNVDALLNSKKGRPTPEMIAGLKYAYDGWNEHHFIASLQGWTELFKSYWNLAHGGLRRLFGMEAMESAAANATLSDFSKTQETLLFGGGSSLESDAALSPDEAISRLQVLNNLILQNAKA
ncbi:S8 family serine peptidase [Pseudocnuella soli]|uniref:S8 family serine peptidase n=1 Tax=Pseudocnuella soli TaxID=2502779 RepID=UPI0010537127|nr:S8 family serine peptidase [Pseudocnuella soli]